MKSIAAILGSVIEGADAAELHPGTILRDIPGWDSMNAINFLLELENNYAVDLSQLDLSKTTTFGELCEVLGATGIPTAALPVESLS